MYTDQSDKEEEKEFLLEFIEVYRSLTSLWDIKNKCYMDRQKREEESNILLEKYQERYPGASKKDVSRKINVLRSNFKRELRRLNDLGKSGAGVDETNSSGLWYFNALRFIQDVETPSLSRSNVIDTDEEPQKKETKKSSSASDELVQLASQRLKEKQSAFQAASVVWALKLESMDPNQAIEAEKIINDAIYAAQLGKFNVSSRPTFGSRASTPFSPLTFNPSSSNSEVDVSQPAFFHSNAPNVTYIRPPRPSPTQPNVVYVSTPRPSPTQSNVVYVSTPTPSPSQPIFVKQPQTSQDLVEQEYIVSDDASQGKLQTFFSTFQ